MLAVPAAISLAPSQESEPLLTRLLRSLSQDPEEVERRTVLHAAAYEQAAADTQLFATAPRAPAGVELRHPE